MVMFLKYSQLSKLFFFTMESGQFFAFDTFEKSLHQWSSSYWDNFLSVITYGDGVKVVPFHNSWLEVNLLEEVLELFISWETWNSASVAVLDCGG